MRMYKEKIRPKLIQLLMRFPRFRSYLILARQQIQKLRYFIKFASKYRIDEKMIVFDSYLGRQFACSPKALYQAMLKDESYDEYKKVIVVREKEKYKDLEKNINTSLVVFRSREYYEAYAKAGYWICNSNLPAELIKKKGQFYVQTWHGIPLKKLGCDLEYNDNPSSRLKDIHRKYINEGRKADCFLSPSEFYTEKIASAFGLKDKHKILEMGYPRNDFLYRFGKDDADRVKKKLGIRSDKKIILYAPTWRDNQYEAGTGNVYEGRLDFEHFLEGIGEEWIVLYRTHYFVSRQIDLDKLKDSVINVSDYDDINELYIVSDVLITDYSSVFFDYAILKRPIVFYMYDYEEYKYESHGFYLKEEELPGIVVKEEEDLIEKIKDLKNINYEVERFVGKAGICADRILKEIIR